MLDFITSRMASVLAGTIGDGQHFNCVSKLFR